MTTKAVHRAQTNATLENFMTPAAMEKKRVAMMKRHMTGAIVETLETAVNVETQETATGNLQTDLLLKSKTGKPNINLKIDKVAS